jgi:hypothetical protein
MWKVMGDLLDVGRPPNQPRAAPATRFLRSPSGIAAAVLATHLGDDPRAALIDLRGAP